MEEVQGIVERLLECHKVPQTRDLTSAQETQSILEMAQTVVNSGKMADIQRSVETSSPTLPANLLQAVKNAESFVALQKCPPCHLTVLFPMYREHNRALPSSEHPNGQDFWRAKVAQLQWLFGANDQCTFDLAGCDDGCDKGSTELSRKIIAHEGWENAKTIHIQEAIDRKIDMFSPLKTPADSRKGGAVLYGLWEATQRTQDYAGKAHLIIYTDSDLSTDLAMSGSLMHKVLCEGFEFAQGARYGYPGSYLVKDQGATPHPDSHYEQPNVMHITMRHFCRMHLLPDIATLYDTNVGFKCFKVQDLPVLLPKMTIFGPAFDMQLLLAALKHFRQTKGKTGAQIVGVSPVLFVEDFAESNFTSNATDPDASFKAFVRMNQEICQMHDEYVARSERTQFQADLQQFILGLDAQSYKQMILGIEKEMGRRLLFGQDFTIPQLQAASKPEFWSIPGMKAGVITGDLAWNLLKFAKDKRFAIPAFNCTSTSSINAVLEAGRALNRPVMIQFSEGGAAFMAGKSLPNSEKQSSILGAVAGAHFVRHVAPAYGIPVFCHSDHCAKKLLPWFDGMLEADEAFFAAHGEPLFSSHMLDLSEEPHEENIGICAQYFRRMAPLNLILEMEIGITGGVEDGVDNTGTSADKLYSTPEDVWAVWQGLSPISEKFTIAAAFGNVHGVYKPGNVRLQPGLLNDFQVYAGGKTGTEKPYFFVFHGGSGSEKSDIEAALNYGVVKMNVDTDTQWAYWEGILNFYKSKEGWLQGQIGNPDGPDKPNKSYYDPRKWVRCAEESMVARVQEGCRDLRNVN